MSLPRAGAAVLTVVASVVLALLLAEVALRILDIGPIEYIAPGQRDGVPFNRPGAEVRYSGWMPLLRKEFETTLKYNSFGFRDVEHALRKRPGVFRIAILGDSFVAAREVEIEETFHRLLEGRLNDADLGRRFEVLAFGLGGTTTSDQLELYEKLVRQLDVDFVVLLLFAGNDVHEISPELTAEFSQWVQDVHVGKLMRAKRVWLDRWKWLRWSRVGQLVVDRTMRLYLDQLHRFDADVEEADLVAPSTDLFRATYDAKWTRAWEQIRATVADLAARVRADRSGFLLVSVDSYHMLSRRAARLSPQLDLDPDHPNREVRRICREEDIECLDLAPVMERLRERGVKYRWPEDGHWTAEGHRVVADTLFSRLVPLLEESSTIRAR